MYFSKTMMPDGIKKYKTHKFLYGFFPETGKREFIFRQDGSGIMMLSEKKPKTQENNRIYLSEFYVGKRAYTFALRCIPNLNRDKKITYIVKPSERKKWLSDELEKIGSKLNFSEVSDSKTVNFTNDSGEKIWFKQADMRGVLEVNDVELFKAGILRGIGRGKAWGCGLIYLPEIMRIL